MRASKGIQIIITVIKEIGNKTRNSYSQLVPIPVKDCLYVGHKGEQPVVTGHFVESTNNAYHNNTRSVRTGDYT